MLFRVRGAIPMATSMMVLSIWHIRHDSLALLCSHATARNDPAGSQITLATQQMEDKLAALSSHRHAQYQ
jgi:hypothetical protein